MICRALAVAVGTVVLAAVPALAGEVRLTDSGFEPAEITVAPGTTIVWTNASSAEHTVVADDGTWDSGPLAAGDTFSITLRREGSYPYGSENGEHTGTVVVSAAAAEDAGEDAEPAPQPVTPDTGLPLLPLAAVAGALLLGGALLVRRTSRP